MQTKLFLSRLQSLLARPSVRDKGAAFRATISTYAYVFGIGYTASIIPDHNSREYAERLFVLDKIMGESPLRFLLPELAQDELLEIRAVAKYKEKEFPSEDEEVSMVSAAIREVTEHSSSRAGDLINEVAQHPILLYCWKEWNNAVDDANFVPF